MKSFLLLVSIFFCMSLKAYVLSRGVNQLFVKWNDSKKSSLLFYLNSANDDGLSHSEVESIVTDSANQWSSSSFHNLAILSTTGNPSNKRNDIYFSSDSLYFNGSGIVGLTLVSFMEDTGEILEADIILNEAKNFKDRSTLLDELPNEFFLGNVISHEMGHAIGLSHSEVHRSTMFYKLANGQHKISEDDRSGANFHWPKSQYNGSIVGSVFGGSGLINIFGAQIQAISASNGRVIASSLSEENGTFKITGLPKNDQYYLYISPLKDLASIPLMYSDVRSNFCNSNKNYRGSFYSSCYSSDRGHPLGITLTDQNPSQDVGHISIKCGLDISTHYFLSKGGGTYQLNSLDQQGNVGSAFVGFFSDSEVINSNEDNIEIDLRSHNVASSNLYLDIKILHQNFFSELILEMDMIYSDSSVETFPQNLGLGGVAFDDEKNIVLDIHERFLLDSIDMNNNIFKIVVRPKEFKNFWPLNYTPAPKEAIEEKHFFQEFSTFQDSHKFYFFIMTISKKNIDGSFTTVNTKKYQLSDNLSCPDAPGSYVVKASSYKDPPVFSRPEKKDDPLGIGCGIIDTDNHSSGGGLAALSFLFLLFIMSRYSFLV